MPYSRSLWNLETEGETSHEAYNYNVQHILGEFCPSNAFCKGAIADVLGAKFYQRKRP